RRLSTTATPKPHVAGWWEARSRPRSEGRRCRLGLIMQLTVKDAHDLAVRIMSALGHDATDATLIADHLIDCELRGLHYGGLARAISIAERIGRTGDRRRPIGISHETPVSARIDGGDHLGYIVAHRATAIAVEKASAVG